MLKAKSAVAQFTLGLLFVVLVFLLLWFLGGYVEHVVPGWLGNDTGSIRAYRILCGIFGLFGVLIFCGVLHFVYQIGGVILRSLNHVLP